MSLLEQSLQNLTFALCWLRNPLQVGAAAPSSARLGRAMAAALHLDRPGPVVELGAGTGAITKMLLESGVQPDRLLIVEREPAFLRILRERFPAPVRVLAGDAQELPRLARGVGIQRVPAPGFGLALSALPPPRPPPVRDKILLASFALMPEAGEFIQYTYGPAPPISKQRLATLGLGAERLRTVWRNLPPASVWRFTTVGA
jgi:phosphatidylethanolamine/phosphatidyl-N-methylethanolamine N-methyltransferase